MKRTIMTGRIDKNHPPRESMLDAWDRAVRAAMMVGDVDALERLANVALDNALVEAVMS